MQGKQLLTPKTLDFIGKGNIGTNYTIKMETRSKVVRKTK